MVGPADPDDRGLDAAIREFLDHGAAETAGQDVVFHGDDDFRAAGEELDGVAVERLDRAGIDDRGGEALRFEFLRGFQRHGQSAPRPRMTDLRAVLDHLGLADFDERGLGLDGDAGAVAARVADGDRAVVMERGQEHVGEFVLVVGVEVDDVRECSGDS